MSREAYIFDGIRTPFGRHGGKLSPVRPDDMAALLLRTLVARNPFAQEDYEDVVLGCTNQAGEDSRNVARHAGLLAGLPVATAGQTINRLCASGLAAVLNAGHAVKCGEGDLFLAGGVESMSRAPFAMAKAEVPFSREAKIFDTTLGSRFPNPAIIAAYGNDSMPQTADNVARELDIARTDADVYAFESQQRYARAKKDGFYNDELLTVPVPNGRKAPPTNFAEDEHPRPEATLDGLAKLKPLFEGGTVTAGNSSGINDGAAALVIGSLEAAEKAGAKPRARIVAGAVAGVAPRLMGLGPVPAVRKCLQRAKLSVSDLDIIEVNEAFAAQVLGCLKQLEIPAQDSRVNPNGGAIAVGHPLGASGARLALTALRQLERQGGRYALVSLCIGVGQGMAVILERYTS